MAGDDNENFCAEAADRLAALPGVRAVSLGGSRAAGTARPDSDWDFAVYYRGPTFDPASLRALGWPGQIFPIGGWGGGVFNGGRGCRPATGASMCTTGIWTMSSTGSLRPRPGTSASSG